MKKILLVLTVLLLASAAIAKDWNKEYKKIIEKCDAPVESRKARDVAAFWYWTVYNNQTYAEFADACTKGKGTAVRAMKNLNAAKSLASNHYSTLTINNSEEAQMLAERLKEDLGALTISNDVNIYIVDTNQINACVHPDGTMMIYAGLINIPELNYNHLLGICAHEMTHFSLQHAATHCYAAEKRAKKNMIWSSIVSGVAAAGSIYAATQGYDFSYAADAVSQAAVAIAFIDTRNFYFKYSRDQEYEADLHAYRFMESAGYGGDNYIEALKIIQKYEGNYSQKESKSDDHPATANRIGVLNYAKAHPEVQHKKPKKTFKDVKFK